MSDSAGVLELGQYNHFRETYVLGVYEGDYMQLTYTIDGYDWCRQRKLPSIPSHERKLYHPDKFQQWPTPRYTNYKCGTGWHVGCCMSSGVEIRRNWGPRLKTGGNGSIEFRNSGLDVRYQLGVRFFGIFSPLHTSLLLWISGQYKWRRHRSLPPADHSQIEVEFPRALNPPKGHPERYWSGEEPTGSYDCVHRTSVCLLPFILFYCTGFCSPGGLHLKRGIL